MWKKDGLMPQSLSKILVHLVFSTKNRTRLITPAIHDELCAYMVGILRDLQCPSILTNCVEDHCHSIFLLSKNVALAKVVEDVKKGSSKWLRTKGREFADFHWQSGYGGFSVSQSCVDDVKAYIANQEERHRQMTFQDEFRAFLTKYEVEYD
jgi:REP element-mobilizing transposase RayT